MDKNNILKSWKVNAENWINSIDNNKIKSRDLATNHAIIETIKKYNPVNILDLGCGEGWLTRELMKNNFQVIGVDGTKDLIKNANEKGGKFFCISYSEIINGIEIINEPFDSIIINFALFDINETEKLLKFLQIKLKDNGKVIIQTLHPYNLMNNSKPYKSKWEENSWSGLEGNYKEPHKWYNRTLEDWIKLFISLNYNLLEIKESINPDTELPLSIIFVLEKNNFKQ